MMPISSSQEQYVNALLDKFYCSFYQGEPLTRLELESLVSLMSKERRDLKRQLVSMRGG